MRRTRHLLRSAAAAVAMAAVAVLTPTGTAHADVVVPPGGHGSVCSTYSHVDANRYWQTCAWADDNEVYFTVNFGNASSTDWFVDVVQLNFYRSTVFIKCGTPFPREQFRVPANSVRGTPTADCARTRSSAAYQAVAAVTDQAYSQTLMSDSLQVR